VTSHDALAAHVVAFLQAVNACSPGCGCVDDYFERRPRSLLLAAGRDRAGLAQARIALDEAVGQAPDPDIWARETNVGFDGPEDVTAWQRGWLRLLTAVEAIFTVAPQRPVGWAADWLAAADPAAKPGRLRELAAPGDEDLDVAVADNPSAPEDLLVELAGRPGYDLQQTLARRQPAPEAALLRLAAQAPWIAPVLAGNRSATTATLATILDALKPPLDVRLVERLRNHPACTPQLRERVAQQSGRTGR
jgi:hypothetical protein